MEKAFQAYFYQQKQPWLQDLSLLSKMNSFSQGMDSEIKPQQDASLRILLLVGAAIS